MSNRKYFGTDGIRGRVGDAPITPDFVLKLGWAAGKVLARHGSRKIIIGKDTRISGYMLESALEAGLAAAGLSALFTGPMPTPAVAYLTRTFRAEAGIVISASHNPFYDNGIKFFSIDGTKLPDAVEEAIEAEMEKEISCVDSAELGKASRIEQSGLHIWSFGQLPESYEQKRGNYKVKAWPALVDERDSVAIKLFDNPLEQKQA
ncbi:DUF3418 domain-containing protein, partial [Escherichia coli]